MTTTIDTTTEQLSPLQQVQLRSAVDPAYRERLLADPRAVLAEEGIEIPASVAITVAESTTDSFALALPPALTDDAELDEEALAGAAGGIIPVAAAVAYGIGCLIAAIGGANYLITQDDLNKAQKKIGQV